ncbi:MAG TPA: sulfatase, partial [Candidatus Hydrogenedentes bacterium]|nr:sulfatase [Candidatus Hydrogenedentota bacterium]
MKQMDRRLFLKEAGAAVLGAGAAARAAGAVEKRPPNVVLFLIDDMGWRDVGCYGSRFYETPNIDRLAAQGMRFTQAYAACPVCSPTRAAVLTGKYPARLHLTDWIPGHKHPYAKLLPPAFNQELPHEAVTLAEALKPAGYATASVGKWHLGGPDFGPEAQGFDVNAGGTHQGQPPSYFSPYGIPALKDGPEGEYLTDRLTDEAVAFIESNRERPFFLYFPHYAVHTPIQAKKDVQARYAGRVRDGDPQNNPGYAAMVEAVDQSVGRVMDALDRLGLAEDTVVIFTSDNGGLGRVTSNAPLREGKGTLYEGGVREPLIVRWPGRIAAGSLCGTPVCSVDFFPTIMEIATGPGPGPLTDGESLVPLLTGTGDIAARDLYWHYPHYHPLGATPGGIVRRGNHKLIEYYEDNRLELYDLAADPAETKNLAGEMPEKAEELRRALHDWLRDTDAQMPTPNPDHDPARAAQA